jgi:hypothetical protein
MEIMMGGLCSKHWGYRHTIFLLENLKEIILETSNKTKIKNCNIFEVVKSYLLIRFKPKWLCNYINILYKNKQKSFLQNLSLFLTMDREDWLMYSCWKNEINMPIVTTNGDYWTLWFDTISFLHIFYVNLITRRFYFFRSNSCFI